MVSGFSCRWAVNANDGEWSKTIGSPSKCMSFGFLETSGYPIALFEPEGKNRELRGCAHLQKHPVVFLVTRQKWTQPSGHFSSITCWRQTVSKTTVTCYVAWKPWCTTIASHNILLKGEPSRSRLWSEPSSSWLATTSHEAHDCRTLTIPTFEQLLVSIFDIY